MKTWSEIDCTIEHEGKKYEAGGSFFSDCSDGYIRGVVYVRKNGNHNTVGTWHGKIIAPANLGPIYRGNYCRMQAITFVYENVKFHGRYCPDTSQAVRVRSTKKGTVK